MGKDKTMKDEKKGFDMEGTQEMPKPEEHGGGAVKGVNVRPKEEAMSLILETLQKAKAKGDELGIDVDTFGGQDAVEPVLDALYAAYEEEGTVPSREGFAERCGDKGLAEFVLDMPRDPFAKKPVRKGRVAAICAGCAAAVAVIGCGVMFALGQGGTPAPTPAPAGSAAMEAQEDEASYLIRIGVSAEGWDAATSSPVIVHVVSKAEGIDFYHAFAANEDAVLEVPAGGYEVSFITPVNADGSIYRVPGTQTVTAVEDDGAGESGDLPFEFEPVAPGDVTAEELTGIIEQVTEAIGKGDETLTGDAGREIAETVEENCMANPNADKEAVEEEGEKAAEATEEPSGAQTGSTGGNGGSSDGNSGSKPSGGSTSKPSGGGTSSGNGNGSSSGGGSTGGSSTPKPSHTHNWVAQTTTVHHDAEYKTVHHDAVVEYHNVCNGCGMNLDGMSDAEIDAHFKNSWNGTTFECGSYSIAPVTVQEAWDEQVLVKEAWDETVTTGYKCSSCGATK